MKPCLCGHRSHEGTCPPKACSCGSYRPDLSPGASERLAEREQAWNPLRNDSSSEETG